MWNKPTEKQLAKLPKLYSTEEVEAKDKVIHMHFFLGGCDWYIAEYDAKERTFFGFAILNGDLENAEWGYVSFDELIHLVAGGVFQVDKDKFFVPKKAGEIKKIKEAQGW